MKKTILTITSIASMLLANMSNAQTYNFTNCNAEGYRGPNQTQVDTSYTAGNSLNGAVTVDTNGIQYWVVPFDAQYRIQAVGATAGNENQTTVSVGHPANITGDFILYAGDTLRILVGQHGFLGSNRPGWGAGGGTFVVTQNDSALVIAGGCGSGHDGNTDLGMPNQSANDSTTGKNGNGGTENWPVGCSILNGTGGGNGGNGAGLNCNGDDGNGATNSLPVGITGHSDPLSFFNGGLGDPVGGGFGGGGGVTNTWGGGGGGYTGGQSAKASPYAGGGGGSYNSGLNQVNFVDTTTDLFLMAHGYVMITLDSMLISDPDVICQNVDIYLDTAGNAYVTAAEVDNGSSDPDGIASMTLSKDTFNCSEIGNNSVTLTVTDNLGNSATCTATINVIDTNGFVNVGITQSGTTLTASASGATYQWINCGGADIAGATSQSYTATSNGSYAVTVTENGCTATSQCIAISSIDFIESKFNTELTVYPNPTYGKVSIDLGKNYEDINVKIRNIEGREIDSKHFDSSDAINFEIKGAKGNYFVDITTKDGSNALIKITKK